MLSASFVIFTFKLFFQRQEEHMKHLSFLMRFRSPHALIVCHSENCWFCLSLLHSSKQMTVLFAADPMTTWVSWAYCQGLSKALQRAAELHEQAPLQACLHWPLQRTLLVYLCRVFSYIFVDIKLRLADLKSFKPGLGTPQDASLLKKAIGLNGQLNSALWRRAALCYCCLPWCQCRV